MVRVATEDEALLISPMMPPGMEHTALVLDSDGTVEGGLVLSFQNGCCLCHDACCWSEDPRAYASLFFKARELARSMGFDEIHLHFDGTEPEELVGFWRRLGIEKVVEIWKLPIGAKGRALQQEGEDVLPRTGGKDGEGGACHGGPDQDADGASASDSRGAGGAR